MNKTEEVKKNLYNMLYSSQMNVKPSNSIHWMTTKGTRLRKNVYQLKNEDKLLSYDIHTNNNILSLFDRF